MKNHDVECPAPNTQTAVFDLQCVLPCPTGHASMLYYARKLAVLNFTAFELSVNRK